MDSHLDSESYWNRSTSKAFSFDDDVDDTGICSGTVGDSLYSSEWDSMGILNDDAVSEASYDNSITAGGLNLSIKSVISDEALKLVLQEQMLDDEIIPKGVPADEELKILRRKMQTTFYSPSPEATAYKLLLGKNCHLEVFKSLQEKVKLLNAVLSNGGGDAIITVLLFMKRTLNRNKFHKILQGQPKALEHYISYLTQRRDPELYELLQLFGKPHDAVMQQFKAICERSSTNNVVSDLHLRQQKLLQLLDSYTAGGAVIGIYQQMFLSSLKLIELIAKERNALDNLVGVNSSPIEVLHACCRKHNNWKEQDMVKSTSPFRVCAEQQISPAQFEWTALNERASAQAYADLECVFERVPTWHPMKQKQFHISFSLDAAILRLYEFRAPPVVLYHFVSKISNATEKLEIANKVKCVKGRIDALASLKDISQLTQLRDSLSDRSEEQFYCDKVLKGLQTKRWSTDSIKLKL